MLLVRLGNSLPYECRCVVAGGYSTWGFAMLLLRSSVVGCD